MSIWRTVFAPQSDINREFDAIARNVSRAPGRIANACNDLTEFTAAIHLFLFCHWDWPGARRYSAFLSEYHRTPKESTE